MVSRLSIASICRILPGPGDPSSGLFVWQRLKAMAQFADVTTIQPIPNFPVLAPLPAWAKMPDHDAGGLHVTHAPMFYVPKILKSLDGLWLYRSVLRSLDRLRRAGKLDCVDAHFGYPDGVGALLAARKVGAPVIVTLRGLEADYLEKPVIGQQLRYMMKNADGCVCVSHFLKDLAVDHGARSEKLTVIHNAIDRSVFHPADKSESRQKCGIPDDVPVVVSVGPLISGKRHHVLISAFAEFLKHHANARLLIVGGPAYEPDYPDRLMSQVASLCIEKSVYFVGKSSMQKVANLLQAADIFALATRREGCCNAVLEALACGLAVVTTPAGDNCHFVNDGVNGFIVPIDDEVALAQGLLNAHAATGWDGQRISRDLDVGDWELVGSRVLAFIDECIARRQEGNKK